MGRSFSDSGSLALPEARAAARGAWGKPNRDSRPGARHLRGPPPTVPEASRRGAVGAPRPELPVPRRRHEVTRPRGRRARRASLGWAGNRSTPLPGGVLRRLVSVDRRPCRGLERPSGRLRRRGASHRPSRCAGEPCGGPARVLEGHRPGGAAGRGPGRVHSEPSANAATVLDPHAGRWRSRAGGELAPRCYPERCARLSARFLHPPPENFLVRLLSRTTDHPEPDHRSDRRDRFLRRPGCSPSGPTLRRSPLRFW